ncbi:hypothetical protein [Flavobacterium sp. HNIBRBA15423]|uniref:hypothetical protein n=1 Tax=Flavobacterium sp. HNIBRBA15423 TaxID=3458683 RepID=UPI0040450045
MEDKITSINWQNITEEMHEKGFAIIPELLTSTQPQPSSAFYDKKQLKKIKFYDANL